MSIILIVIVLPNILPCNSKKIFVYTNISYELHAELINMTLINNVSHESGNTG